MTFVTGRPGEQPLRGVYNQERVLSVIISLMSDILGIPLSASERDRENKVLSTLLWWQDEVAERGPVDLSIHGGRFHCRGRNARSL